MFGNVGFFLLKVLGVQNLLGLSMLGRLSSPMRSLRALLLVLRYLLCLLILRLHGNLLLLILRLLLLLIMLRRLLRWMLLIVLQWGWLILLLRGLLLVVARIHTGRYALTGYHCCAKQQRQG